ncbi:butyrate kinase [Staphylococcus chromogenes]|uniref:butyrate kinase n=1 Tax=Staphylococcus chromogenes TaxID=46126 RepID=UPI000D1AA399|nr:butyrate kinase [Staphylococcus chromogenes]PTG24066.1 butyrate kinase [Staphylococcus chromogenes]PTG97058.1 butyrate kinase [Staphylococcus chromogenes]
MSRILVFNLGSTSSKLALYEDDTEVVGTNIVHDSEITILNIMDQKKPRREAMMQWLSQNEISMSTIDAIACRGGLLKPIPGGTYKVNEEIYKDLKTFKYGVHASNLSAVLSYEIGEQIHLPVFISDPVVVDELIPEVRFTGFPEIQRKSIFHALNQKAVAKKYAEEIHKNYEQLNLIVIHMGGGVSVAAHKNGKVIDVNEALYGEGPMALNRSGTLPNDALIDYQKNYQLSNNEMKKRFASNSGLQMYTRSTDFKWIMANYEANPKIKLIIDTFAIQIAKTIGERATLLQGNVDQIIFTGGMSYSNTFIQLLRPYIEWIASISVYPGEFEMQALAENTQHALNGIIPINRYS